MIQIKITSKKITCYMRDLTSTCSKFLSSPHKEIIEHRLVYGNKFDSLKRLSLPGQ